MDIRLDSVCLDEIDEFIDDDNVTDINWNGKDLWISDLKKGVYKSDLKLSSKFVKDISNRFANMVKTHFNKESPLLEAQTDKLRISIYHESVLAGNDSIAIRKLPPECRISEKTMLETNYCSKETIDFLKEAIKAHCNIVIGGLPGAGKTELLKFLSKFIPANERAVTIEDSFEIHYSMVNPEKDCVEIRVGKNLSFEEAIKGSLRHNAKWTLLSEARGEEVNELIKGICDGCHILTTIHTDDAKSIPDRMAAMAGDLSNERFINILHNHLDIGIMVEASLSSLGISRRISQIVVFSREYDENKRSYENFAREVFNKDISEKLNENALLGIKSKLRKVGI